MIQDYMRGIRHSCGGYNCGRLVNKKKLFEILQLSDKMCLSRRKLKFTYSKDVFSPKWIGLETTGVLGSTQFKQAQQMSNEHLHKSTSTDIGA